MYSCFYNIHCLWVALILIGGAAHADEWMNWEKSEQGSFEQHESKGLAAWRSYENKISEKWGQLTELPGQKLFVQYADFEASRLKVNYDSGDVSVEVLVKPSISKQDVTLKIEKILNGAIESKNRIDGIINQDEIKLKYKDARAIINDHKISAARLIVGGDGVERVEYRLNFRLANDHLTRRAEKIYPLVKKWSEKYRIDPALVLAIIRQESAFNPRAKSAVPCYGLMQIHPLYAGKEVLNVVTGKSIIPQEDFLYDPEKNIMIGTTYLELLRDRYFPEYSNDEKKIFLMIASYNWGPERVQHLMQKEHLKINDSSRQFFEQIELHSPRETQVYLVKVIQYREEYRKVSFLAGME
jgi:membrane-bound lytic murein transglycosylase C